MFEMFIVEHLSTVPAAIVLNYSVYYAVSSKLVCHYKHSHGEKEREQGLVSMFNERGDVRPTRVCSWFREGLLHSLSVENIVNPECMSYLHSLFLYLLLL